MAVVLGLPLLPGLLHLTGMQYGMLAGLTVYAVPQVLAATVPLGTVAVHIGTLVKLVSVLMLGPVVLGLSLLTRRMRQKTDETLPHVTPGDRPAPGKLPLHKLVPWIVIGFLGLAALRSMDLVPHAVLPPVATAAKGAGDRLSRAVFLPATERMRLTASSPTATEWVPCRHRYP